MRPRLALLLVAVVAMSATAQANPLNLFVDVEEVREHVHKEIRPPAPSPGVPDSRLTDVPCEDGMAGPFECAGIDLLAFVPLSGMRQGEIPGALGGGASDLWGWTDPEDGGEYVMMGKTDGTAFFDITEPTDPVYLGDLPNPSPGQLIWHDIKVHDDHAYIVSESVGHGMIVFDLTRLRGVDEARSWTPDTVYPLAQSVHNIAINTDTGFAYLVGGNNGIFVPDQCRSGLHIVDISTPTLPTFAGCHLTGEGGGPSGLASYIHDTQCVVYDGPDERYAGRELCFNSSEDHMSIVDVTDKLAPVQVGLATYPQTAYAHQGWLTDDGRHFLMGDELDEGNTIDGEPVEHTRTLIFDVTDIEAPEFLGAHEHDTAAIDHNMYVKDGLVYQSNYAAGLRVLDTTRIDEGDPETSTFLHEVAFFDSYPRHDRPEFVGSWSNYPYFGSGTIAWSGIDEGLFLGRVHADILDEFATPPDED